MSAIAVPYRVTPAWGFVLRRAAPYSVFALLRALSGWEVWRANLSPDFYLYTHGGPRFYPSPLGTLLGSLAGVGGMVILSALAAAAIPVWVSYYSSGVLPLVAATFLPALWLTAFAGIDWIAVTIFLVAWCNREVRLGKVGLAVACLLHFALVPVLLAMLARRLGIRWGYATWLTFGFLTICSFIALLLTPYAGILAHLTHPHRVFWYALTTAVTAGLCWQAVSLLPGVEVHGNRFMSDGVLAFTAGALEAGVQLHSQVRYCVPGLLLLCLTLRERRRS